MAAASLTHRQLTWRRCVRTTLLLPTIRCVCITQQAPAAPVSARNRGEVGKARTTYAHRGTAGAAPGVVEFSARSRRRLTGSRVETAATVGAPSLGHQVRRTTSSLRTGGVNPRHGKLLVGRQCQVNNAGGWRVRRWARSSSVHQGAAGQAKHAQGRHGLAGGATLFSPRARS